LTDPTRQCPWITNARLRTKKFQIKNNCISHLDFLLLRIARINRNAIFFSAFFCEDDTFSYSGVFFKWDVQNNERWGIWALLFKTIIRMKTDKKYQNLFLDSRNDLIDEICILFQKTFRKNIYIFFFFHFFPDCTAFLKVLKWFCILCNKLTCQFLLKLYLSSNKYFYFNNKASEASIF
jgi:hypothetical protein